MTWQLALSNFTKEPEHAPVEIGPTKVCPVCGKEFAYTNLSRRYCSEYCRSSEKAKREKAQRHARGLQRKPAAPRGQYKATEECVPQHQHLIERRRYWKEVFGNVAA